MQMQNLEHISTGQPTYWPTDKRKVPDVLEFAVTRRISPHSYTAESSTGLTSDHSPVFITLNARYIPSPRAPTLSTKQTGRPFKHFYRRLLPHKFPSKPRQTLKTTCTSWCKQYSRQRGAPPLPPALPHAPNLRPPDQTKAHREAAPQEKMVNHPIPSGIKQPLIKRRRTSNNSSMKQSNKAYKHT